MWTAVEGSSVLARNLQEQNIVNCEKFDIIILKLKIMNINILNYVVAQSEKLQELSLEWKDG